MRRGQVDNKSFPYVFLGVIEESNGWRLFDPINKKIVLSRVMAFEDEKQRNWDCLLISKFS